MQNLLCTLPGMLSYDKMNFIFETVFRIHCICMGYCSHALLGTCAYNSTGRKYTPISEMRLITNDIPRIGSALQLQL